MLRALALCCEITDEVFAILSGLNIYKPIKPVWQLYKTGKGYGLKLYWRTDGLVADPIDAHPKTSTGKRRSRRRLEEFLKKKCANPQSEEGKVRSTASIAQEPTPPSSCKM